jgi:hypothetical protein
MVTASIQLRSFPEKSGDLGRVFCESWAPFRLGGDPLKKRVFPITLPCSPPTTKAG